MLKQALVLLSDEDGDAPDLPGVCTVSKDDAWDHGAYEVGRADAARGALWVDRPYFTGNPSVDWMVAKVNRVGLAGGYCQVGNEQNLSIEGWDGGPQAWHDFEMRVRSFCEWPNRVLGMPPSPGVPGWEAWITREVNHAVHAYGSLAQMRGIVEWYLDNTAGDLFVTECNFGAGNEVVLERWADDHLRPFLDWCATEPRVRMAAYFAHRWRGAPPMPTRIDAAGSRVETVLRAWTPPEEVTPVAVTKGVDISNNQGAVDLGLVKAAGYEFAAIKASGDEGASGVFLDPTFPENWHAALGQGMARIAYHYAKPSRVGPAQSVTTLQRAVQAVGGLKPGDGIALDLEDPDVPDGTSLHVWTAEWLALAESVFGVLAWKYSARFYTSTHDIEHADLAAYPTWWASWQATVPAPVTGWGPILLWQNSASARVPGVHGDCDTDVFMGTVEQLRALGLPASAGPSGPEPPGPDATTDALNGIWASLDRAEDAIRTAREKVVDLKSAIGR